MIAILGSVLFFPVSCATTGTGLTLQDLPSDYEPITRDQLSRLNTLKLSNGDLQFKQVHGFIRVKPFSMVIYATAILDAFTAARLEIEFRNPGGFAAYFQTKEFSDLVSDVVTEKFSDQIGADSGLHASWTLKPQSGESKFDMELIIFRHGKVAFLIYGMNWHGEESIDLMEIAKKIDARAASAQ